MTRQTCAKGKGGARPLGASASVTASRRKRLGAVPTFFVFAGNQFLVKYILGANHIHIGAKSPEQRVAASHSMRRSF